jgi:hypothetical protein
MVPGSCVIAILMIRKHRRPSRLSSAPIAEMTNGITMKFKGNNYIYNAKRIYLKSHDLDFDPQSNSTSPFGI